MRSAYAYLRKSVVQPSARTLSWEMQEQEVRALAARYGDTTLTILSDWGRSGRTDVRSGYRALLAAIEADQVSVIYAYSLSRLSRSLSDYARLADLCVRHSVRVRLAKEGESDFGSPSGRVVVTILAAIAQMEAELAQERGRDIVRLRRERGEHMGQPAYGEKEGEDVGTILTAYEAAGSISGAARWLNQHGVPTRYGRGWCSSTVRSVLARKMALPLGRSPGAKRGQSYLLARLLRCACGHLLTPQRPRRSVRYWCSRSTTSLDHPYPRGVAESQLVAWVRDEAARLRVPDPELRLADTLSVQREVVVERLRRNRVAYLAGDVGDGEYMAAKGALDEDLARIDAEGRTVRLELPDWEHDSVRHINGWLQALWVDVQLDVSMRPVRAHWRLPAWRGGHGEG